MSKVLILKVVRNDLTSYGGFKWPESGPVSPERWDPSSECGNGLHGWLNGEGNYRHEFMSGKWIVMACDPADVVKIDGGDKCKARTGDVVYCGDKTGAIAYMVANGALTKESNPGWCCFTNDQLRELAYRSADRAVRQHAPKALRARKREAEAVRLESLPKIVDYGTASAARDCARQIYRAAYAAADAYAAYAAYAAADAYAADAAYAAYAAADAADAYAAYAAADAAYAAYAADAAAYAAAYADAYAAANAAAYAARKQEREANRLDRISLLGL